MDMTLREAEGSNVGMLETEIERETETGEMEMKKKRHSWREER